MLQGVISRLGQSLADEGRSAAVHATTVGDERGGAMLVGPSWTGKSTLAAALMASGMRLVAEDITIFDDDLRARPYHRPLGLAKASFELVGLDVPEGVDDHCGCGGKMLASADQLGFGVQGATPIRLVALCDRTSGTLQRISPARMLVRLLEKGVAPLPDPGHHLDVLARVLAQAVCVELGTESLPMATEWVHQIERPTTAPSPTLVEVHGDRADVFCGDEAVIVHLDELRAHHLNRSAAAVWLLHTDGLDPAGHRDASSGLTPRSSRRPSRSSLMPASRTERAAAVTSGGGAGHQHAQVTSPVWNHSIGAAQPVGQGDGHDSGSRPAAGESACEWRTSPGRVSMCDRDPVPSTPRVRRSARAGRAAAERQVHRARSRLLPRTAAAMHSLTCRRR